MCYSILCWSLCSTPLDIVWQATISQGITKLSVPKRWCRTLNFLPFTYVWMGQGKPGGPHYCETPSVRHYLPDIFFLTFNWHLSLHKTFIPLRTFIQNSICKLMLNQFQCSNALHIMSLLPLPHGPYRSLVRPCKEFSSHRWQSGEGFTHTALLNKVDTKAIVFIVLLPLNDYNKFLTVCGNVVSLATFHRLSSY